MVAAGAGGRGAWLQPGTGSQRARSAGRGSGARDRRIVLCLKGSGRPVAAHDPVTDGASICVVRDYGGHEIRWPRPTMQRSPVWKFVCMLVPSVKT